MDLNDSNSSCFVSSHHIKKFRILKATIPKRKLLYIKKTSWKYAQSSSGAMYLTRTSFEYQSQPASYKFGTVIAENRMTFKSHLTLQENTFLEKVVFFERCELFSINKENELSVCLGI